MAISEQVAFKKKKNIFHLIYTQKNQDQKVFEPDEDFYKSISAEDFKERAREVVKEEYKKFALNQAKRKKTNLSDFFGALPNFGDGLKFQKNARNEWN